MNVPQEIEKRYQDHINDLICLRFKILAPIAIALHLSFQLIDNISPAHYNLDLFWKIRCVDAVLIGLLFLLSFLPKFKAWVAYFPNAVGVIMTAGMAVIVYLSEGSSSRYYEGINLLFLGVGVANSFFVRGNLYGFALQILMYVAAMLLSPAPLNQLNFSFASYFLVATAVMMIIMTKFYRQQHYSAFVRQEQLALSEAKLALLYRQADTLSKTDELTQVHNRRYFFEELQKKIARAEDMKAPFYLIIFDVDKFKVINDNYGHAIGDQVLVKVVGVVKNFVRLSDVVGRFGGDEFMVCLDIPTYEDVHRRLSKISDAVRNLSVSYQGQAIPVSISIGAARFSPGQGILKERLLEMADNELFNVKKSARGGISITR